MSFCLLIRVLFFLIVIISTTNKRERKIFPKI